MGWGSGSRLMGNIILSIEQTDPEIDHDTKVLLFSILIEEFEQRDCDTLDECVGQSDAFDEAYWKQT